MEHGKEEMTMLWHIDSLMLEPCHYEIICEHIAEWARHQKPVSEKERLDALKAIVKTPNA